GDLILLSLPTGVVLLRHFHAVLTAGAVPALIPPGTPSARLRELAEAMGARAVGAVALHGDLGAGRVERVGLVEAALFPPAAAPPPPGGVVVLPWAAGGWARGCVTPVGALARNALRHADAIGQRPGDTVLVSLPLHFSYALVAQSIATLLRGGRLVIAGPPFI